MNWISVKDKMPEDATEVSIAILGFDEVVQGYYNSRVKKWFGSSATRASMVDGSVLDARIVSPEFITHWMPLPEPPTI